MNKWVVGGGALAVLLLAAGRASAALMPSTFSSYPSSRDLDALADMLIAETSFGKSKAEMAQIVWVAYNRARRQDRSMWFVVQPGSAPSPVWNTGSLYRIRFNRAREDSSWTAARDFVKQVLSGSYPNYGYTSFVHPGAMPQPPCSSNRVSTSTPYGTRCLPSWIVQGKGVGSAWFA